MSVESALPEHHQSTSSDAESFEVVNLRPGDVLGEVLEGLGGLEAYCASIRLIEGSCWYYVDPDNPCVACGGMDCEQWRIACDECSLAGSGTRLAPAPLESRPEVAFRLQRHFSEAGGRLFFRGISPLVCTQTGQPAEEQVQVWGASEHMTDLEQGVSGIAVDHLLWSGQAQHLVELRIAAGSLERYGQRRNATSLLVARRFPMSFRRRVMLCRLRPGQGRLQICLERLTNVQMRLLSPSIRLGFPRRSPEVFVSLFWASPRALSALRLFYGGHASQGAVEAALRLEELPLEEFEQPCFQ